MNTDQQRLCSQSAARLPLRMRTLIVPRGRCYPVAQSQLQPHCHVSTPP